MNCSIWAASQKWTEFACKEKCWIVVQKTVNLLLQMHRGTVPSTHSFGRQFLCSRCKREPWCVSQLQEVHTQGEARCTVQHHRTRTPSADRPSFCCLQFLRGHVSEIWKMITVSVSVNCKLCSRHCVGLFVSRFGMESMFCLNLFCLKAEFRPWEVLISPVFILW